MKFIYLFTPPFTADPLHALHRTRYNTNRIQINLRILAKLLTNTIDNETDRRSDIQTNIKAERLDTKNKKKEESGYGQSHT